MTDSKKSADEMFESLTGFDEIAIEQAFGAEVASLRHKPTTFMRALVFVAKRREGLKDMEAKHAVMSMPIKDVLGAFDYESEGDPEAGEG